MKVNVSHIIRMVVALTGLLIYSCAQVGAPTGGERDTTPPVVVRSSPPNYSANYTGEDVRITFDEYVKLKGLRENMLISPPLANDPEVRIRGRSLIMSITDTLLPNTTYNFFFGESVVDITEDNPISNFQYVVSTGAFVDSLSVMGVVQDALTLKPPKPVFVMLYENVSVPDSAPLLRRPVYLTKTNTRGEFRINNMREGSYLMFALNDLNSNYIYDNPEEQIAFLDTLITPRTLGADYASIFRSVRQTTDSIIRELPAAERTKLIRREILTADSLTADSIFQLQITDLPYYRLNMFQEKDTFQRVLSSWLAAPGKINLAFRIPADSIILREYVNYPGEDLFLHEYSRNRDTLGLWFTRQLSDTLFLEVSERDRIIDSVRVSLVRRADRSRAGTRTQEEEVAVLSVAAPTLVSRGAHPYFQPFILRSATPLQSISSDNFRLLLNDSIPLNAGFFFADSLRRTIQMDFMPMPDSSYVLMIPPGSITDIFGTRNDSLKFSFKATNPSAYGTIILQLTLPEGDDDRQYILQLLTDAMDNVVQERVITQGGTLIFEHLPAGNFRLRLIDDQNSNGTWDTGHYMQALQPEPVFILGDRVTTRLNWEVEITWRVLDE